MTAETTWTLGALLNWTAKHLAAKGVESPRLDAEVLLAFAAGCKRIDLYGIRHQEEAPAEVRTKYKELIRNRLEGCPVAYLVGRKEFFGLELTVSPAVLIPRPDTEHVVLTVLDVLKKQPGTRVLDLGTGSGCIPIALAKSLPNAQLTAIDVSADALAIAKQNADKHKVAERIRFVQGDLFAPLAKDEKFDVIASNPPYIAHEDMASLPPGVKNYEPHLALDGGAGGFAVFDRILESVASHLVPGGWLVLEIGSPQEASARKKIEARSDFELAPTIFDSAKHPRVLKAHFRPVR